MLRSRLKKINKRRTAACIMGILFLLAVLASSFYLAAEANHDCRGGDCPICACMQQCENLLHRIGAGEGHAAAVILPAVLSAFCIELFSVCVVQETPVSRKVRLND